jgi:phenylalanyl-tRNA synthetase beta chain
MVDRLARCGQRSVTALVDISNYVMFEWAALAHLRPGQDPRRPGRALGPSRRDSSSCSTATRSTVDEKVGVIADDAGGVAGRHHGRRRHGRVDDTRNVYVEAAFWWPEAVAGRSRRFNFSTDAGHRFERGVDPALTVEHIERITQLILDICGGRAGPWTTRQPTCRARKPVTLRVARAAKVIGMPLTQRSAPTCFSAWACRHRRPGTLTVTPPSYRFDLRIEEDLIEEVVRIIGYEQLPTRRRWRRSRRACAGARAQPFAVRARWRRWATRKPSTSALSKKLGARAGRQPDPIRLLNPIASQMSVMRSSLLGSLLQVLKFNLDRKAERVRVFELGRVFLRDASVATTDTTVPAWHQPMRVAGLAYGLPMACSGGARAGSTSSTSRAMWRPCCWPVAGRCSSRREHPALHPGRCARVWLDGRQIGLWVSCTRAGARLGAGPGAGGV